jgi:hypothetical protein
MPKQNGDGACGKATNFLLFCSGLLGTALLLWLMMLAFRVTIPHVPEILFTLWMLAWIRFFKWAPRTAKWVFAGLVVGLCLALLGLLWWIDISGLSD